MPTTDIFDERSINPKQCFKTVRNASYEANAMAERHEHRREQCCPPHRTVPDLPSE